MAEGKTVILFALSSEEVRSLQTGVNFKNLGDPRKKFIIVKEDDGFKVVRNICKHLGGRFIKDIEECVVKCMRHGWKLDCVTMRYINPEESFSQDELLVEIKEDGGMEVKEIVFDEPWLNEPTEKTDLSSEELVMKYHENKSLEFNCGDKAIFIDPGYNMVQSSNRGSPIVLLSDATCNTDRLLENYWDVNIYMCTDTDMNEEKIGTTPAKVNICECSQWIKLGDNLRVMFLKDTTSPHKAVIVDYKGYIILYSGKCVKPNGGKLPREVHVLIVDVNEEIRDDGLECEQPETKKSMYSKIQMVREINPNMCCPIARCDPIQDSDTVSFGETKVEEFSSLVKKYSPQIKLWEPKGEDTIDLSQEN